MEEGIIELIQSNPLLGWGMLILFGAYRLTIWVANKLKADSHQDTKLEKLVLEKESLKEAIENLKLEVDAVYKEIEHLEENVINLEKRRYADMELIQQSLKDMTEKIDSNYERVSEKVDKLSSTLVQLFTDLNFNKK